LGLRDTVPAHICYQLLHRTASAIIEAKRFGATYALMIVHSFSENNTGYFDFGAFVSLYGIEPRINDLQTINMKNGISLKVGWVQGDKKYLGY
jgi:hypothetical protein